MNDIGKRPYLGIVLGLCLTLQNKIEGDNLLTMLKRMKEGAGFAFAESRKKDGCLKNYSRNFLLQEDYDADFILPISLLSEINVAVLGLVSKNETSSTTFVAVDALIPILLRRNFFK
jgi:hypothetical protein